MLHRASSVVSQTKGGLKGTSHEGTPASRLAADRSPFAQGRPRDSSPQASQAGSQARPALTGCRTYCHPTWILVSCPQTAMLHFAHCSQLTVEPGAW